MKKILVAAALLTSLAGFGQLGEKIAGKIKFEQGQTLLVNLEMKTTVAQEAMGQSIDFNVDGIASRSYKVTNATDDNNTLRHEMKKISFNFDGMGQQRSFDSDIKKDLDGPFGKPVKDILGKTYDMIIDPAGKVLMVQPEKIETTPGDDRLRIVMEMLKDLMSTVQPPAKGDASFFKVLPDNEIGKGESWTETGEKEGGKSTTTYTLADITDSTIVVDFTGISNTVSKAEMMGMPTTTTMSSKMTGQIIIDKATGIIRRKTTTTESTGTTEMMGGSLPLTSKTTTIITVAAVK